MVECGPSKPQAAIFECGSVRHGRCIAGTADHRILGSFWVHRAVEHFGVWGGGRPYLLVCRPQQQGVLARERSRCLGAALEIALCLARRSTGVEKPSSPLHQHTSPNGRVLIITTGPTTKVGGPGIRTSARAKSWFCGPLARRLKGLEVRAKVLRFEHTW
jgi:hypothetical protein